MRILESLPLKTLALRDYVPLVPPRQHAMSRIMAQGSYTFLFETEEDHGERVFYDPTKVRRRKVQRLVLAAICLFFCWVLLFFDGVVFGHRLTESFQGGLFNRALTQVDDTPQAPNLQHDHRGDQLMQAAFHTTGKASCNTQAAPMLSASAAPVGETFFGHLPATVEWAALSLQSSCGSLDVLVPDWISIIAEGSSLKVDVVAPYARQPLRDYVQTSSRPLSVLPTVSLDLGFNFEQHLDELRKTSAAIADSLIEATSSLKVNGLCVAFDGLQESQLKSLQPLFDRVTSGLHAADLQTCIILSANQKIWAQKEAMKGFDRVILKAFAQPWVGSVPGPLATDTWFQNLAKQALDAIGADRLTLAIGNFAVEWTPGRPLPEMLPYAEAVRRISQAGGSFTFSAEAGNSFGSYSDPSRKTHKIWLLDAASAHNQIIALRELGVRNIGLWSLGQEDPGLWDVVSKEPLDDNALAQKLAQVSFPNYVAYQGEGSFLRMISKPQVGLRTIGFDPKTHRINDLAYNRLPEPYLLERYGRGSPEKLVLTFDDGPNPVFTKALLDALEKENTPAAFFVVGTQIMAAPELLKRMYDEGHEIGSHTFSHPRMNQISKARADFEFGMMSKLIASYSNHSTLLYREPYMNSSGPVDEKGVRSLLPVLADGGIIAGMEILARDWEGLSKEEIVKDVVTQVEAGAGNVILLHDGGDNRQATVDAIPILIKELTSKGYQFTTLADLAGVDRAILMPPATGSQLVFDRMSFGFMTTAWLTLKVIFWVVLAIGITRTLMIFILALFRKSAPPLADGRDRKVTVIIPAHNEEAVVAKCIRSVLASNYDNLEVVAIDDGSMDNTFYQLLTFRNNPRVRVLAQFNQGKWRALNAAIASVDSEIIVCIDADTQIHPDAIGHLAKQFSNPRVGAVAGKIIVGNRTNLLTRLQALEYITAQNFDRRGFDLIDGMMVVPGAIGAWRTEALRQVGGFCNDTITEDADMTISVHRLGYRITYEDRAIAYTEAPETIRQLLSQRLRWSLGMFQCAWKHKAAFRERRAVGVVAIPDMIVFGYIFPLLAPLADFFILILLFNTLSGTWTGDFGEIVTSRPNYLIWAYLALPLLDLLVALYALKTDKDENISLAFLFPFQRLFYRQLLYLSVYRAVFRAISGSFAGWGKLKRTNRKFVQMGAQ